MEILGNYSNSVGVSAEATAGTEEKKSGFSKFLDSLFWWTGKAGEVYESAKTKETEPTYSIEPGHEEDDQQPRLLGMPRTLGIVLIGTVAVIGAVLIYKKVKK